MTPHPAIPMLDSLFEPYECSDAPGLVVGVALGERRIYRRGLGMASLEHGVANTPSTRMRIGSTTKHFCCLGVLLLEEDGQLDAREPVRTYLPELQNHFGETTLLQLMHHTGGLPEPMVAALLENGGYFGHAPLGSTMHLLQHTRAPNFAPGTRMAYSNAGYTLLTLVIERLSGMSWNDFMTRRVFAPCGLRDTQLAPSDLDIVANLATAHFPLSDGHWRRGIFPSEELHGSGGMVSTVDDMLTWAAQLRSASHAVGRAASWARLHEPQTFAGGTSIGYGLGLMTDTHRGVKIVHHAGATVGATCQLLIAPAHALDIVVMTNRMDVMAPALAQKVLECVLGDVLAPETVLPAAADHRAVQGRWFSRSSRTLMSIAPRSPGPGQAEALMLSIYNTPAAPLLASGEGLAKPGGPSSSLEIRTVPRGEQAPRSLDVHICGELERFEHLPDAAPEPAAIADAWCGRYRHAESGKRVEIVLREGKLVLDLLPRGGFAEWTLEPFSDDVVGCGELRTALPLPVPLRAVLTLDAKDEGAGFWFDTDRLRNVRFDRCREQAP